MGGLFSKPKAPAPPKPIAPAAVPEIGAETEEMAARRARRRGGFRRTIITGALEPDTGKKTLLG